MTLTADHMPVEAAVSQRDEAICDLFTTALEGGIGYWSVCSKYRWSIDGGTTQARDFIAVIEDSEGDGTEYVIDRGVITRGVRKAYDYYRGSHGQPYITQALTDFTFHKWDDLDYDATVADVVVQFGLFDHLVYG